MRKTKGSKNNRYQHQFSAYGKKYISPAAVLTLLSVLIFSVFAVNSCDIFTNEPGATAGLDIAITSLEAPSSAVRGQTVDFSITVENLGNAEISEAVNITLADQTNSDTLTTETLNGIEQDTLEVLTYSWNTGEASPGGYRITASHDFQDSEPSNDTSSVSLTVDEPSDSDLAVTEINAPSSSTQGDVVDVEVTVANTGEEAVSEEISVILEDLSDGVTVGMETISELPSGETAALNYSWDTGETSAGEHELQASHDFSDDNSTNNSRSTTVTINEPRENDLAITEINLPSSITQGQEISVEVTVENSGNRPVEGEVMVVLENRTEGGEIGTRNISGPEPGETATLSYSWDTGDSSTGEHELLASHDYEDDNNDNNSASVTATVDEQEENDIAVTDISAPSSVTRGEEADIEVTVENSGNQTVDRNINVLLEDQTDGTDIGIRSFSGLEPGEAVNLSYSWDTEDASTGEHELQASHNYSDDNNANNRASESITVNEPAVLDISISRVDGPSSTEQGNSVDIEVTVENSGNQEVDQDISVVLEDQTDGVTIGTQTVDDMDPGETEDLEFEWNTGEASPGEHNLLVFHGLSDDVSSNNSGSITVAVNEPPAADIAITEFEAPPSADRGEEIEFEVIVENLGGQEVEEDFEVTLEDQSTGMIIDTEVVGGLDPGESEDLEFEWDTEEESPGEHNLLVSHSYIDENGNNDSLSETVVIVEPLLIDDIDPDNMETSSSIDVTVTGSGFQEGISVTLENGDGPSPEVSNIQLEDSGTLTATITTQDGGPPRDREWDVRVTNPNDSTDLLEEGFTVTVNGEDDDDDDDDDDD